MLVGLWHANTFCFKVRNLSSSHLLLLLGGKEGKRLWTQNFEKQFLPKVIKQVWRCNFHRTCSVWRQSFFCGYTVCCDHRIVNFLSLDWIRHLKKHSFNDVFFVIIRDQNRPRGVFSISVTFYKTTITATSLRITVPYLPPKVSPFHLEGEGTATRRLHCRLLSSSKKRWSV